MSLVGSRLFAAMVAATALSVPGGSGATELLANGDAESGLAPWMAVPGAASVTTQVQFSGTVTPAEGSRFFSLVGSCNTATSTLSQSGSSGLTAGSALAGRN